MLFESGHVPLERIFQDTVYVLFDINGLNFVKKIRKSTLVLAALAVTKIYVGQTVKNNSSVEYVLSTTTNTFRILKDSSFIDFFAY